MTIAVMRVTTAEWFTHFDGPWGDGRLVGRLVVIASRHERHQDHFNDVILQPLIISKVLGDLEEVRILLRAGRVLRRSAAEQC